MKLLITIKISSTTIKELNKKKYHLIVMKMMKKLLVNTIQKSKELPLFLTLFMKMSMEKKKMKNQERRKM